MSLRYVGGQILLPSDGARLFFFVFKHYFYLVSCFHPQSFCWQFFYNKIKYSLDTYHIYFYIYINKINWTHVHCTSLRQLFSEGHGAGRSHEIRRRTVMAIKGWTRSETTHSNGDWLVVKRLKVWQENIPLNLTPTNPLPCICNILFCSVSCFVSLSYGFF